MIGSFWRVFAFTALLLAVPFPGGCGNNTPLPRPPADDEIEFEVLTDGRTGGVDPNSNVTVKFNLEVNEATVTWDPDTGEGSFRVVNTLTGEAIAGEVVVAGDEIVFTPDGGLGKDIVYRVELAGEIESGDGQALGEELALLISTQDFDRVNIEVLHPWPGRVPKLLTDVCYDVQDGRAHDIEWLRKRMESAQDLADERNIDFEEPRAELYSRPLYTKFHFWPNLINLTEVYYGDDLLYATVIDEFLEFDPDRAALQTSLQDDILAGERVFLARDFITFVQDAFNNYDEVHYGFLLNLDDEWVKEVLVHDRGADGLPTLHDPHVDDLQDIFDDVTPKKLGEVWELCLRANIDRGKHQSIIIDRFDDDPEFYLRRLHVFCTPTPDVPVPPVLEVPIPPPGGPGGGGGGGGDDDDDDDDDGGGGGGAAGPPAPPKNPKAPGEPKEPEDDDKPFPWPWPGPDGEEDEPGEPEQGTDAPKPQNCTPEELAAIKAQLEAVANSTEQKNEDRFNDYETFKGSRYQWDPGASYLDDCLKKLFEEYQAKIGPLAEQLAAAEGELAGRGEQKQQMKTKLDPVLDTSRIRENIWDNMLTTGGPWSNVRVPCMPPWIPAGGSPFKDPSGDSIIIITVEQQAKFQKDIYKGLVRGLSFNDAVKGALDNGHNYPPNVVEGDKIYQLIWKTYAECLKKLYEEMSKIYLARVYPGASAEQLANAWKVMCEGKGALTPAQQAAFAEFQAGFHAACVEEGEIHDRITDLKKQIEDLRREFRRRALDECFKTSLIDLEKCRTKRSILDDFVKFVTNPDAPNTFVKGDHFCEVIDEMLAQRPPPCLQKYLEALKKANCKEATAGGD